MLRLPALAIAALVVIALPTASGTTLQRFESVEPHMGTLVRITVYTADDAAARRAFRAGFDRIRELDAALSDYREDSELSRLTREAVGRDVPVGPDLFAILQTAQRLAVRTDGAFDITQGPVVRLWREARRTGRLPDEDALREAASRSGYSKLHLNDTTREARVDVAGMALDAGALGKGYAASEALDAIRAIGVGPALVAVSGDLAFGDAPPGQRGWRVRLHDGDLAPAGVPEILELENGAMSTAGSAEQHVVINGRRYSHIVDPVSRLGLEGDITVTVIAPRGIDADALDTAASVLGVERGLRLIESHPDAAGLIVVRGTGPPGVTVSSRFATLLAGQAR